jgi:SHS2 domain-containing protein
MAVDRWEHFAHGADIGVRGLAASKSRAFELAAMALTAVMTDPATLAAQHVVSIQCEAPDDELLLVDWLNAIVFETATRKLLFGRFEARIDGHQLDGKAWGEPINIHKHAPTVEVKGATLTSVRVAQEPDGIWVAQCVVDV